MEDKLKNKIAELKEQLSEERELRKSLQRELNDARKLLGKARALADKMSGACSALIEAVEDDSDKKPGKGDSDKKPRTKKGDREDKPGKPNKVKGKAPKKVNNEVDLDDDYED